MDAPTLEAYITQVLDSQPDGPVEIAWQGGEPTLMGLDFFRQAAGLIARHARPGQQVQQTIQTNGTQIDAEWADFLAEHRFLVGLSIDGPRPLHDAFRVRPDGRGSFEDVIAAWQTLSAADVDTNVLCSVHRINAEHPVEVYRFLRDNLGARHLQFIPIVERVTPELVDVAEAGWREASSKKRILYRQVGDLVSTRSVTGAQYGSFLTAVYDEWIRGDVGTVFVQLFDVTLGAHLGQYSLCVHAPTCGNALALEHNGDLYSCDHFVEPDHLLGNIHEHPLRELAASAQQVTFGRNKLSTLADKCRRCPVLFACNGGCPKDRFVSEEGDSQPVNYLCDGFLEFFGHSGPTMQRMADLLRRGHFADEIMSDPASDAVAD